jgi:TolB-like protein
MADVTATTAPSPEPPHVPSVFISYAAEDRTAARLLRDTLAAAGLDVWYDENELSGGDSWDQKIRRQIRDCDYFMPVISASTEARKEGYFRREWRLATERTLDMADDVLFLLPVAIDDTAEGGARVPEKFLSVQWLRAPGGQPTPALTALLERLRAGDHHALPRRPSGTTRAPFAYHRSTAASAPGTPEPPVLPPPPPPGAEPPHAHTPPPMPPFPAMPAKSDFFHGVKFLAEVLWWLITVAWLVLLRLPKWARIIVGVWILLSVLSSLRCSRTPDPAPAQPPGRTGQSRPGGGEGQKKMRQAIERATQGENTGRPAIEKMDFARIATEVAHVFGEGFKETAGAGKPLIVIPFSRPNDDSPGGKFAHAVFLSLYGRLSLERRNEVNVVAPVRGEPPPAMLHARATALGANFVLTATITGEGETTALKVRLYSATENAVAWTESFPVKDADETAIAEKIAAQVLERIPRKEPRRPKGP